jgi:hypothetical protein
MNEANSISKLDSVVLLKSIPSKNLKKGDVGCVVEVHEHGMYEIEFIDSKGRTRALLALPESYVMRLNLNIAETT